MRYIVAAVIAIGVVVTVLALAKAASWADRQAMEQAKRQRQKAKEGYSCTDCGFWWVDMEDDPCCDCCQGSKWQPAPEEDN